MTATATSDALAEAAATGRSLGVEEEFLLVDGVHDAPAPLTDRVPARARTTLSPALRPTRAPLLIG